MAGAGRGSCADRIHAQLLGELVKLLATQRLLGYDLIHGARG